MEVVVMVVYEVVLDDGVAGGVGCGGYGGGGVG